MNDGTCNKWCRPGPRCAPLSLVGNQMSWICWEFLGSGPTRCTRARADLACSQANNVQRVHVGMYARGCFLPPLGFRFAGEWKANCGSFLNDRRSNAPQCRMVSMHVVCVWSVVRGLVRLKNSCDEYVVQMRGSSTLARESQRV